MRGCRAFQSLKVREREHLSSLNLRPLRELVLWEAVNSKPPETVQQLSLGNSGNECDIDLIYPPGVVFLHSLKNWGKLSSNF